MLESVLVFPQIYLNLLGNNGLRSHYSIKILSVINVFESRGILIPLIIVAEMLPSIVWYFLLDNFEGRWVDFDR